MLERVSWDWSNMAGLKRDGWNGAKHERGMEESVDIPRSDSRASRTERVIMITFFTFT